MQKVLSILVFLGLLLIYFWGAGGQAVLQNKDMHAMDQSAYMDYSKKMHETDYAHVGGRDRMPIYPFFMSLLYQDGMSDEAFFELGKKVNFLISLLVLVIAFFVFLRHSNAFEAGVATAVVAFTVFVYKSPYFQVEILFYGVVLLIFVLMVELISRPRWSVAILAGLAAGVGHLTKASVIPSVLLCTVCLLYAAIAHRMPGRSSTDSLVGDVDDNGRRRWIYPIVFVLIFLAVISPYLYTSKKVFGQYFYNVSSTFYMWYDSWGEAKRGTRAYGDRVGWPKMADEDIPSMSKYFREHSLEQVADRVTGGLATVWKKASKSYGYLPFVLFYAISCLAIVWSNRRLFIGMLADSPVHRLMLFFLLAYFSGYLLLYAWYVPIGSGNRFVLSFMLPLSLLFVRFLSFAKDNDLSFSIFSRRIHSGAVSPVVALMLAVYLLSIFPHRVLSIYGGT